MSYSANRQTDIHRWKHNLLGRGTNVSADHFWL